MFSVMRVVDTIPWRKCKNSINGELYNISEERRRWNEDGKTYFDHVALQSHVLVSAYFKCPKQQILFNDKSLTHAIQKMTSVSTPTADKARRLHFMWGGFSMCSSKGLRKPTRTKFQVIITSPVSKLIFERLVYRWTNVNYIVWPSADRYYCTRNNNTVKEFENNRCFRLPQVMWCKLNLVFVERPVTTTADFNFGRTGSKYDIGSFVERMPYPYDMSYFRDRDGFNTDIPPSVKQLFYPFVMLDSREDGRVQVKHWILLK